MKTFLFVATFSITDVPVYNPKIQNGLTFSDFPNPKRSHFFHDFVFKMSNLKNI